MIRQFILKKAWKGKEKKKIISQDYINKINKNNEKFNNKKLQIHIYYCIMIKLLLKCEIIMIFRIILEKKV